MAGYLFHWWPPLEGGNEPAHYFGWTPDENLERRIHAHLNGGTHQAKIIRAALAAGRDVRLVAVFPGLDRTDESRLKKRKRGFRHMCPCPHGESERR